MGGLILVLAGGWMAGIALVELLPITPVLVVLAAAATSVAALVAPAGRLRLLALGILAVLLGLGWAGWRTSVKDGPDPLAGAAGQVVVQGRVLDAPTPRGQRAETVLHVTSMTLSDAPSESLPVDGTDVRVLLRAPTIAASYGDLVEVRGHLARPRSRPGWPLAELLARRGIRWTLDAGFVRVLEPGGPSVLRFLAAARAHAEATTRALLPEPHASLLAGMVFGARAGLPPDLRADLLTTGTSHLTAVSGANVAMVAGALLVVALSVVARGPASLLAMVGVWLYALLVGAPPSALRAAAMATVALAASGLGRQPDALAALMSASALLLGWDPGLAYDVGFQLSVAATAGLILLTPPIEAWLGWLPGVARGWVSVAVAAQLATLPIVLGTFQRLSLISLPANVLAAPLVPPIMFVGALVAILGWVPGLGALLGWVAWGLTALLLLVIEWCADVPGAMLALGRAPAWLPFAWYGLLLAWIATGSADLRRLGLRPAVILGAVGGGALALGVTSAALGTGADRAGQTVIVILDVEPSAALIRAPDGRTALLLTGEAGPGVVASASSQLELWEHRLDIVLGPDGLRTGVDLLSLGAQQPADTAAEHMAPDDASAEVSPGVLLDLGGPSVVVVDARQAGERPVIDLLVQTGALAVVLPGPGTPSDRWPEALPDLPVVARLPRSAVSWARTLPPRHWLLLVGDPGTARARGESPVPLLLAREYGAVELTVQGSAVGVRSERCAAGRECYLELPPPVFGALLTDGD